MKEKDKQMERLVERFLDGLTTREEEQELYDYFQGRVRGKLKKYQPMFQWYAEGMPDRKRTRRLWPKVAVAASVAAAIGAGLMVVHKESPSADLALYEGSYIIRNGQKNCNLEEILPELELRLCKVEQKQRRVSLLLKGVKETEKNIPTI